MPKNNSQHRYQEVAAILRREIETKAYPLGSRLPSEQQLCDRFDISRFTIREALKQLTSLGLVHRRQGSGTVVISHTPKNAYVQKVSSMEELVNYGPQTTLTITDDHPVGIEGGSVALPKSEDWHVVKGQRSDPEGNLIGLIEIYVPAEFSGLAKEVRDYHRPVYQTLEHSFGVRADRIAVDITAVTADAAKAQVLEVPVGSPVLRLVRSYKDETGRIIEISVADHPAGQFTVSVGFDRQT